MAQSAILKAHKRAKLGSTSSRSLRAGGNIPANIQGGGDHIDISIEEREFLASRRAHVHLYDIDVEGTQETAVVQELQWDTFGDKIIHIEFKKVVRGVAIDTDVDLAFLGVPKSGVVNLLVDHIRITCIPSLIPDNLAVKVESFEEGSHIKASDLILPEGITLACDLEMDIATIVSAASPVTEEPEEDAEGGEEDPLAPPPAPEA
jgi:large subunit ribosomal protein L25